MAKRDYYEVLSVTRTATEVEITKSWRSLAMKHHPDRNPGDAEAEVRFKEITEAYEVLRDPAKRRVYDTHGHDGLRNAAQPQSGFGGGGFSDLFDAFSDFLGGAGSRGRAGHRGPRQGSDVQAVLDIDLVEAATGVKKTQTIPREEVCVTCTGTGAKPGTAPKKCQRCNGQGAVILNQGFLSVQQTCRACGGRGSVVTDPCGTCRGNGRVESRHHLEAAVAKHRGFLHELVEQGVGRVAEAERWQVPVARRIVGAHHAVNFAHLLHALRRLHRHHVENAGRGSHTQDRHAAGDPHHQNVS